MIYHLLTKEAWEKAKQEDVYWPKSLDEEGFVHCLTKEQLLEKGNKLYPNESEIVLLQIYSNELESLCVFEDLSESGEMFPHIYGHVNLNAVKFSKLLKRNGDTGFTFETNECSA
ncbi:DUF952 domain-containing protein [Evansella sp. AB-rgal1]|uniref:DUF952 domain-containing protein n=1 Tax=Evansella sp. AB-rgal1 TaxID=3242696 RepID=UPI00359CFBA4